MRLAICGMHFSAQLGVAEACCLCCSGYCALFITLSSDPNNNPISSFDAVVGQKIQLAAKAYFSDCTLHDFSAYATWSSSNPAVASVAAGLVTPVAGGSSAISATDSLKQPGVHLVGCGGCPGPASYRAQATANDHVPYQATYINTLEQGAAVRPSGQAGWSRLVQMQLQDQSGKPINVSGIPMADIITPGTRNDLGASTRTGSHTTDSSGIWPDTYFVCSTACPASTGETDAAQNWTYNGLGLPHFNAIVYKCKSVTIDGH